MKRIFTLLVLLISISAYAQDFEITPDVINFNLDGTEETSKIGYTLKNNTDSNLNWYWTLTLDDDFPKEWNVQICDQTLCWAEDILIRPTNDDGNVLEASSETNSTQTYVQVKTNGVAGTGEARFCVYDDKAFSSEIICTTFSTSVSSENIVDINIFPNPANDFFQLTDNEEVSSIQMYDIVGKMVMEVNHMNNKQYDISHLRNGLYIVRLLDRSGSQVKSLRLSKR